MQKGEIVLEKMQNGETALMQASGMGRLDVVNRLLDCKDIDVNLQCIKV